MASTFSFRDETDRAPSDVVRLATMVTVVDRIDRLRDDGSDAFLREHGETVGDDDAGSLVDLLVEQIEFADVGVFNEVEDVSDAALDVCPIGSERTTRFGPSAYRRLPDPFPQWRRAA